MNVIAVPPPPPPTQPYKDRRVGLIIFGIIQFLISGFFFLMAAMMAIIPASQFAKTQPAGARPVSLIPVAIFYFLVGAGFVVLGIGSIQRKNWARIGTLIVSWIWLFLGIIMTSVTLLVLPMISKQIQATSANQLPTNFNSALLGIVLVFYGFFFVVVPGIFLLFYHRRNVRLTCLGGIPNEPADRLPWVLIVLGIWQGFGAISVLFTLFSNYPVVIFGQPIFGTLGRTIFIGFGLVSGYCAVAFFRRDIRGWWVALVSQGFWMLSGIVTLIRVDLIQLYRDIGMDERALAFIQNGFLQVIPWLTLLFMSVFLGLLLYSRRFFIKQFAIGV